MTYQLHTLRTQLDDGTMTAGDDCAVMGIINALLTISDGKVGPQNDGQVPNWVRLVRTAAGKSHGGLLFHTNTYRALRSPLLMREFDKVGLPRPFVEVKDGFGWAHGYARLKAGWVMLLPILYRSVNHPGNHPRAPSGSLSFQGGHLILAANYHPNGRNGWLHYDIADSLMDGRERYVFDGGRMVVHRYPKGWQRVRAQAYRKPAGDWGDNPVGAGRLYGIFLKPRH